MTRAFLLMACILAAGCGSSDPEPVTAADTGSDPFESSGANGTFGSRNDACTRVASALNNRATAVGCPLVGATCPRIVDELEARAGVAGQCMEYDLGTVANCEARISTYTTCADFETKGCQLGLRKSDPANCSAPDAGADGG